MTVLQRIENYRAVWAIALPHLAPPSPQDAARWGAYPVSVVETAILRAGRRFSKERVSGSFDPVSAYRYVTATARSMEQNNKAVPESTTVTAPLGAHR